MLQKVSPAVQGSIREVPGTTRLRGRVQGQDWSSDPAATDAGGEQKASGLRKAVPPGLGPKMSSLLRPVSQHESPNDQDIAVTPAEWLGTPSPQFQGSHTWLSK